MGLVNGGKRQAAVAVTAEVATEAPAWQQISGLSAEREKTMDDDARDQGIRKLLAEVERLARLEFARGAQAPAGERTVFWDPL